MKLLVESGYFDNKENVISNNESYDDVPFTGPSNLNANDFTKYMQEHKNDVTTADEMKFQAMSSYYPSIKEVKDIMYNIFSDSNANKISDLLQRLLKIIGFEQLKILFTIEEKNNIGFIFKNIVLFYIKLRITNKIKPVSNMESMKFYKYLLLSQFPPNIETSIVREKIEYNNISILLHYICIYTELKLESIKDIECISIHIKTYMTQLFMTYLYILYLYFDKNINYIIDELNKFIKSTYYKYSDKPETNDIYENLNKTIPQIINIINSNYSILINENNIKEYVSIINNILNDLVIPTQQPINNQVDNIESGSTMVNNKFIQYNKVYELIKANNYTIQSELINNHGNDYDIEDLKKFFYIGYVLNMGTTLNENDFMSLMKSVNIDAMKL